MRLWKSLYDVQGLQKPRFEGLEDYVYRMFVRMYRAYLDQKDLIPPANFVEVRYERLVRDPLGEMRTIYDHLGLDDFEKARPQIEAYVSKEKDYKTNRYELPAATRDEITRRWGDLIQQLGYPIREADGQPRAATEAVAIDPGSLRFGA